MGDRFSGRSTRARRTASFTGPAANAATVAFAAKQATAGAKPLPMTGYKLDLLSGVVKDLLEQQFTTEGA
jgi:xanthine dehydrogenase YagS FAD-binding subunit